MCLHCFLDCNSGSRSLFSRASMPPHSYYGGIRWRPDVFQSIFFLRRWRVKELQLRKWHRCIGVVLALFLFFQAGSGMLLSLEGLPLSKGQAHTEQGTGSPLEYSDQAPWDLTGSIHHGGGTLGALYRLALGTASLWMALSGAWIYWKIRKRSAARRQ